MTEAELIQDVVKSQRELKQKLIEEHRRRISKGEELDFVCFELYKELQALHKEVVDIQNDCVINMQSEMKKLQEENTRLKKESETIIQDLLSNSDEYARQRAMDWLKEE